MYRDASTALDEHDRAVGAILIGEALVEECERAAARSTGNAGAPEPERWRALTSVHDTYPEIWRHLDRARRVLSQRGANTAGYDELRPHARRAPSVAGEETVDACALDDAKRAIAELKLAVPGADWAAIETRTAGLVSAPLSRQRRNRLAIGVLLASLALGVTAWRFAIPRPSRVNKAAVMRQEIATIQVERKVKIEWLRGALGDRCEPAIAHELVKQLVLDGRTTDANAFGTDYIVRCGEDSVVDHWAHAPRPGH